MTYDFDDGSSSSSDSQMGPFINWHARETLDGALKSRTFSIRDEENERTDVTPAFKKGVVFDLASLATGWCYSDGSPGVAPEWEWNDTPAKFKPQPADRGSERFKKGFKIKIALNKDKSVLWSQSGAGAFEGLKSLMASVKKLVGDGDVVVASMSDVEEIKYKKGGTSAPIFTAKKWTERPECLTEISEGDQSVDEDVDDEF